MNNKILKGQLKRWNTQKGFGFIKQEQSKEDIFMHISSLKGVGRSPREGDIIFYQIYEDNNGKKKAVNAKIDGIKVAIKKRSHQKKTKNYRKLFNLITISVLILIGINTYKQFTKKQVQNTTPSNILISKEIDESSEIYQIEQQYQCEEKTYCSQMTSCDEAIFYINNCPNTKMDGNHDGVPCESQWC